MRSTLFFANRCGLTDILYQPQCEIIAWITVTIHGQDMDVMGQAVEQCAGEPLGAENRCPVFEWQVGGDA
jgi:hypothetical protein